MSFTPGGKTLAVVDPNKKVRLWDVATHKPTSLAGFGSIEHIDPVFGSNGTTFAITSDDETLRLWDITGCS